MKETIKIPNITAEEIFLGFAMASRILNMQDPFQIQLDLVKEMKSKNTESNNTDLFKASAGMVYVLAHLMDKIGSAMKNNDQLCAQIAMLQFKWEKIYLEESKK